MNFLRSLKYGYLAYFSKPIVDRFLVRVLNRIRPSSIVLFGLADQRRTDRLCEIALWHHSAETLRFVGIDLFEARDRQSPGISLRQAHSDLKLRKIKVQLVPGDPLSALARTANSIPGNDLVIISSDQDATALTEAWFFMPRILHPKSTVLIEEATGWRQVALEEVHRLASNSPRARRRAA